MNCRACGKSWVGWHRCGETRDEADTNARAAALQAENERLRAVILDAYRRCERIEALLRKYERAGKHGQDAGPEPM